MSTGWPGSTSRAIPSRPAASAAPSARCGLQLPSTDFSSILIVPSSRPQYGEATRTGASRLSNPQQWCTPDQESGDSRW